MILTNLSPKSLELLTLLNSYTRESYRQVIQEKGLGLCDPNILICPQTHFISSSFTGHVLQEWRLDSFVLHLDGWWSPTYAKYYSLVYSDFSGPYCRTSRTEIISRECYQGIEEGKQGAVTPLGVGLADMWCAFIYLECLLPFAAMISSVSSGMCLTSQHGSWLPSLSGIKGILQTPYSSGKSSIT